MTDEENEVEVSIYVLPSETGMPPRAMVGPMVEASGMVMMVGTMITFSQDLGMWVGPDSHQVKPELAEALSERCRELEVPGF